MLVPLSATEWLRDPMPFGWRGQAGRLLVPGKPNPPFSWSLFLKWAAVVVGLGVCAVGIFLLWGVWDGSPVAAAFTRVGGATQVETALEASRFWLTPPQYVVETEADASQQVLLGAAQCAMAYDAPLLFTSSDPARQQLVNATINDWQKIETPEGPARPEVIPIHIRRDILQVTLPEVIPIRNQPEVNNCLASGGPVGVAGLSTLEVPNPLIRLPQVPAQQTLAPVVVFAAAIQPGNPPDVAVGLALAAHMARANREKVSLVVVPHYLESDLELEEKLQSQHELVTGGVVLGQTPTVPEDTLTLLRQLLASRDRQGVLAQLQDNLGSVGTLIAALLALAGAATAAGIGGPIVIERLKLAEQKRADEQIRTEQKLADERKLAEWKLAEQKHAEQERADEQERVNEELKAKVKSNWIMALGESPEVTVTIWLRSGRQVTGTIEDQFPANDRDATVFRIKNASLVTNGAALSQSVSLPGAEGKCVLVSVKDIELININDSKPEAAKADQTSAGRGDPN